MKTNVKKSIFSAALAACVLVCLNLNVNAAPLLKTVNTVAASDTGKMGKMSKMSKMDKMSKKKTTKMSKGKMAKDSSKM